MAVGDDLLADGSLGVEAEFIWVGFWMRRADGAVGSNTWKSM